MVTAVILPFRENSHGRAGNFFFNITVTFIALWFYIPVYTLFNLPWSSGLAAFVLSFTLQRLSYFINPHLMLWKHFHCYLFSVIAIYYCCVLYAPVSSPFSTAIVIKMYLFQLSWVLPMGGWGAFFTAYNSVALVRTRTIPTERPPPVGEVSAKFCG